MLLINSYLYVPSNGASKHPHIDMDLDGSLEETAKIYLKFQQDSLKRLLNTKHPNQSPEITKKTSIATGYQNQ